MAHASIDAACPAAEDIAAFVAGGLAAPQRTALEVHVAGCEACRRLLSALARAAGSEPPVAGDSMAPTLPLGSDASDTELQPGARFGRYAVLDWLGAGGMGVVYSAYDAELNRGRRIVMVRGGYEIVEVDIDSDHPPRVMHRLKQWIADVNYAADDHHVIAVVDRGEGDIWLAEGEFP